MDGATLSRIGEMFFTTKEGGHGIGLAACFRIAKSVGGQIDVDSEVGRGSTLQSSRHAGVRFQ